jgi:DNA-binding NarL/FixJ family response regulator
MVLDIVMPEMSGTEAAYKIRQLVPAPKIVLISSHYTPGEAAMLARLFGDATFIPKSEAGKALVPAVASCHTKATNGSSILTAYNPRSKMSTMTDVLRLRRTMRPPMTTCA